VSCCLPEDKERESFMFPKKIFLSGMASVQTHQGIDVRKQKWLASESWPTLYGKENRVLSLRACTKWCQSHL